MISRPLALPVPPTPRVRGGIPSISTRTRVLDATTLRPPLSSCAAPRIRPISVHSSSSGFGSYDPRLLRVLSPLCTASHYHHDVTGQPRRAMFSTAKQFRSLPISAQDTSTPMAPHAMKSTSTNTQTLFLTSRNHSTIPMDLLNLHSKRTCRDTLPFSINSLDVHNISDKQGGCGLLGRHGEVPDISRSRVLTGPLLFLQWGAAQPSFAESLCALWPPRWGLPGRVTIPTLNSTTPPARTLIASSILVGALESFVVRARAARYANSDAEFLAALRRRHT